MQLRFSRPTPTRNARESEPHRQGSGPKWITPDRVRALFREKLDSGLAPRSVLHIHRTLSKALNQATDDGLSCRVREAATASQ
jgi:hypothetical protein